MSQASVTDLLFSSCFHVLHSKSCLSFSFVHGRHESTAVPIRCLPSQRLFNVSFLREPIIPPLLSVPLSSLCAAVLPRHTLQHSNGVTPHIKEDKSMCHSSIFTPRMCVFLAHHLTICTSSLFVLFYIAISDGVAPRAKMNQQRSRRFKTAKENAEKDEVAREVRAKWESEGRIVPPIVEQWDSNVITPGTPFLQKVSDGLKYYVQNRLNSDPGWKNVSHCHSLFDVSCLCLCFCRRCACEREAFQS